MPVTLVVVLFSVIQTFADFQLVYVMTGGGPANATHLFATYAYQLGIGTGLLAEGAAISLAMFPFLFIIVVVQLLYIRRVETPLMIEGALWRRWVFYNIPLILFVFVLLFPFYWMIITTFRPDGELYRPWNAVNYMPFWTNNPTLEHIFYLFEETNFMRWMFNTMFIALVSTVISLFCGVLAGYALARLNFPYAGGLGTAIFHHLPGAADSAVHPAGGDHP